MLLVNKFVKPGFLLCCLICSIHVVAQVKVAPPNSDLEQQLENITQNNDDIETEDDSYQLELAQYLKDPLNLNTATAVELTSLRYLNALKIQNLLSYRNYFGKFINIYELQAIPDWDVATIRKILPYVTISSAVSVRTSIGERLKSGDHYLQVKATQVLERSRGYLLDSSTAKNFYPGSPQRIFIRYRYNYKNTLQYGFAAEKDPGEQFFKGAQKKGFDFYTAHFFAKNIGIIKAIALGDFSVNLGQGLTSWMSLAFKKSANVTGIERQAAVLRPYSSAGEIYYHRGAGITIGKRNWEATVFGSYRKVDANFNAGDTSLLTEDYVSSLQTSGYHRTKSESEDKGAQTQLAFGGNASWKYKNLQLGLNAVQFNFKLPLTKDPAPYNYYSLTGKSFGNYSTDYSYTYKNLHFFGEVALSSKKYTAFINGLLISVAQNVDMSFLYRNISKGYQSIYTSAFTESTFPTNEKGLFSGISIRANDAFRIDAYADMYRFPYLKYRVNAPTIGKDYLVQVTYKPNKVLEMYVKYKTETKSINFNPDILVLSPVVSQPRQNLRTQFLLQVSTSVTLRSRAELVWYDHKGAAKENGSLIYADFIFKPMLKALSGNVRLQYFETGGYNSRIYAYENDILYSYSIPAFFGKGYRYYVNINYDLTRKFAFWLKLAQTYYPDQTTIGSGLDVLKSNRKTEVKLQGIYRF